MSYFTQESLGYVNRKDARDILQISDSTLQRWTKLGLITKHKVRGKDARNICYE